MDSNYHVRDDCRLCGSKNLRNVLQLAPTPPANEFVDYLSRNVPQDRFPLYWCMCVDCAHIQLPVVVDPERLFRNYKYVSGTAASFVKHFDDYAATQIARYGLTAGNLVFEVGSNDGTLLKAFQKRGIDVLGVDPASAIVYAANADGVPTLDGFFDHAMAADVASSVRADLVVANNVFAHVDDLGGLLDAIRDVMQPQGHFVFEVSYVGSVIRDSLFDTIYHEHLSYHGVIPLRSFLDRHGFRLTDVEFVDTHGGSIRCHACLAANADPILPSVAAFVADEEGLELVSQHPDVPMSIRAMADGIEQTRELLRNVITDAKTRGERVVGFGAPAKATTLMYAFGLGPDTFEYIVDDSPLKQGLFSPGLHVPIVTSDRLYSSLAKPDIVVVLAWNFAQSIVEKHGMCGAKFVVPLPIFRIGTLETIPPPST